MNEIHKVDLPFNGMSAADHEIQIWNMMTPVSFCEDGLLFIGGRKKRIGNIIFSTPQ